MDFIPKTLGYFPEQDFSVRFYSKIIIGSYATTNTCYLLFFVNSNFSRKKTATTFWKFSGNILTVLLRHECSIFT